MIRLPARAFPIATVLMGLAACERAPQQVPPSQTVRIATGPSGAGPFGRIVEKMGAAHELGRSNLRIDAVRGRTFSNAADVQDGHVDIGLSFSSVAYVAFRRGKMSTPYEHLRAIAVLHVAPIHLLVRPGGGIRGLDDLRGKRIGVGSPEAGALTTLEFVLEEIGWSKSDINIQTGGGARELMQGQLDAVMRVSLSPSSSGGDAEVLPIGGPAIDRLLLDYPFLMRTVIPAGSYRSMPRPVPTIGVQAMVICRDDLPEALVYDFTQQFFESLSELSASLEMLGTIRIDESSATPIPLHRGAARFYRERELQR